MRRSPQVQSTSTVCCCCSGGTRLQTTVEDQKRGRGRKSDVIPQRNPPRASHRSVLAIKSGDARVMSYRREILLVLPIVCSLITSEFLVPAQVHLSSPSEAGILKTPTPPNETLLLRPSGTPKQRPVQCFAHSE
ncbi:unnamed protein product, partial [Amoebophrya sp. A120]|eukprot:GSA120T00012248001.1